MNKLHLPTLEEFKALQNIKTIYITLEINPDTVKDRMKKIHDVSKLEREAKMLDTYFVKRGEL